MSNQSRFECLNKAAEAVADREGVYGKPEDNFLAVEKVYHALVGVLPTGAAEGIWAVLFLCALKLVRAAAAPGHADNWVDLAGYAALGYELVANAHTKVSGWSTSQTPSMSADEFRGFADYKKYQAAKEAV